jgi:hypothetical protein
MYQLPKELQDLIYSFDNTYQLKFNEILKSISKKYVSEFKYKNKYTHRSHCNIKVQNYTRHELSISHIYNSVHSYRFLSTVLTKLLRYIKKNNITFEYDYQINFIIYNTQVLENYEIVHLSDNDRKALYKLINHYI